MRYTKVAGKENGRDLFTKALAWDEIMGHERRLGGEFIESKKDVEVSLFGGGDMDVQIKGEVERMARELKLSRPVAWQRSDMNTRTAKTTMKGGPSWERIQARITADAHTGEVLRSEKAEFITKNVEHALLPDCPRDIVTMLLYEGESSDPTLLLDRELCNDWRPGNWHACASWLFDVCGISVH